MSRFLCILFFALFAHGAFAQTNQSFHPATGVVIAVSPAEKQVTIQHDAIPGYMQAMAMPFDVADTNQLTGLTPGDAVSFRIVLAGNRGWIDQLQKSGAHTNLPTFFRQVQDVQPLAVGDFLPEYHLTNQLGHAISTAQFKGQAVAITFLFTRCPYPNFCPLMANNFADVQKKLLATPRAATNWQLLTISFDPEFDTPAVLRQYAKVHGADATHSSFATGALIDITAIGEQFGLVFSKDNSGGIINHNLRTIVLDTTGRVQKIFIGNTWQPDELVTEIQKAAKVPRQ